MHPLIKKTLIHQSIHPSDHLSISSSDTQNLGILGSRIPFLRPLISITFPQGFRKSKLFGHGTLGSGGKKTFKQNKQMKKIH